MYNKLNICDFYINDSSQAQALTEVEELIESGNKSYVCFCEANLLSNAVKNDKVSSILNDAAMVYPDGKIMQLMTKCRYNKNIARVTGPDFILNACDYGQKKGWRHFFYGGAEGVADTLAEKLKEKYPDMIVAGSYCPPFRALTDKEETQVKTMIEDSKADLLWVGLGGPKQEIWMSKHLNQIDVPVMLGVGAAFDFHSGNRPWAPKIIRKLGLEWLFRAVSGGRKTFFRNMRCIFIVLMKLIALFIKYRILKNKNINH
jgi:N-acetylglucosaminyldiphosphoundecaprenol N-acetyl-beta-D-mannosaminyltransferase